ncbi:hypothetical protein L249_8607 [Ophiocordyceps polyrhachis-furcata BCC 54312]|uniref:Uncharacterized protein n=1 Tax=Ophiocordyceps polyrhachis-furcata BCC 54312 TaxID=1330021 RepID=A0A367L6T7_9HYPO|nr:hypothetical protein L249_8607 [Ophiocordyceps polyrhachis-furcata BCC 54312]
MPGSWALLLVRHHRQAYLVHQQLEGHLNRLGETVVAMVPEDAEEYKEWLAYMRDEFSALAATVEQTIFHIRPNVEPAPWQYEHLDSLPTELPRLKIFDAEFIYMIDLDREVLSMQFGVHFKLNKIPRRNNVWLDAIRESVLLGDYTIDPNLCPTRHMASLALPLPPASPIEYKHRVVKPKSDLVSPVNCFLTHVLGMIIVEYHDELNWFGREWRTDSLPFREITFALVSVASGKARFGRLPDHSADDDDCFCCDRFRRGPGWFDEDWIGTPGPLLEFGSMAHQSNQFPGVAPRETIYWHDDVLVSLALKITGDTISDTVTIGLEFGQTSFQFVVMSLFEIAFGEVYLDIKGEPFVKVTESCNLSPVRPQDCLSTHPTERPVLKPDTPGTRRRAHLYHRDVDVSPKRLAKTFPGLAALVNFFSVAADRRAARSKTKAFPLELYDRVLDFADYDTWKSCLVVSTDFRRCCLRRFRVDERMKLAFGPFWKKLHPDSSKESVSFDFEDARTGRLVPMGQTKILHAGPGRYTWRPIIIGDQERLAIMMDVKVNYQPVSDRVFGGIKKPDENETTTVVEEDDSD